MRRGDKCIHLKYGTDYAVNSGNLMYFAPLNKLEEFLGQYDEIDMLRLQNSIYKIYNEEMFNLHFG